MTIRHSLYSVLVTLISAQAWAMGAKPLESPTSFYTTFRFRTEYAKPADSMECEIEVIGAYDQSNRRADLRCRNEIDHSQAFQIQGLRVEDGGGGVYTRPILIGWEFASEAVKPENSAMLAKVQDAFRQILNAKQITLDVDPKKVTGFLFNVILAQQDLVLYNQGEVDGGYHPKYGFWLGPIGFLEVIAHTWDTCNYNCEADDSYYYARLNDVLKAKFRIRGAVQLDETPPRP